MKKQKRVALMCMLLTCTALMTACTQQELSQSSKEIPKYYSVSMDGEYLPKSEDDPDIAKLKEISGEYLEAIVNRNYNNIEKTTEYSYYTEETYNKYMVTNRPEIIKESVIQNKLIVNLDSYEIQHIEFYTLRGQQSSTVLIEYISSYIEGDEEYLNRINVKKDVNYKRDITITFIKENDNWKVQEYLLTIREEI